MENIKKQTKYCTRILYGDNGKKIEVSVIYNPDKYTEEYVREMQEEFTKDSEEIRKKYFSTNIQLERVQNRTFFDLLKIFIQRTKKVINEWKKENKLKIKTTLAKDRL